MCLEKFSNFCQESRVVGECRLDWEKGIFPSGRTRGRVGEMAISFLASLSLCLLLVSLKDIKCDHLVFNSLKY